MIEDTYDLKDFSKLETDIRKYLIDNLNTELLNIVRVPLQSSMISAGNKSKAFKYVVTTEGDLLITNNISVWNLHDVPANLLPSICATLPEWLQNQYRDHINATYTGMLNEAIKLGIR